MAYRDPVFNANVLTDLLGSYLDVKNKEREKYYQAEQKKDKDKTVIRQGADGFLYYINPATKKQVEFLKIWKQNLLNLQNQV